MPIETADEILLDQIRIKYGADIAAATHGTPFPPAVLAALTANESGLDEAASRFEPSDFWQLAFVSVGLKAAHDRPAFGSIRTQDLQNYLGRYTDRGVISALISLAKSWGPTQIMGYEALAGKFPMSELLNVGTHYKRAVQMLAQFQQRFRLAAPATPETAEPYFHCWNAGSPTARTYDPDYPANGVKRYAIFEALPPAEREA